MMGNDDRQPASLNVRFAVICETIAQLRMECSCQPSELGAGRQREVAAPGTCTASILRMHQQA